MFVSMQPKEPTLIEEPILIEMKEKVSLTLDLKYVNSFSKVCTQSD